ncbi:MAG: zf-HC2 domain-containing protein [Gemmatimonadetes bacterium]|nr:zf-HC2 domain-containing protein [Gemmatimonadota bacterium]
MTTTECLAFQQAVFEAGDGRALLARRPDLATHHDACAGCRAWLAAFAGGVETAAGDAGFAASVMARSAGGACGRAREQAAAALDEPLPGVEQTLVAAHLASCAACRAVVEEMAAMVAALPALAEIDPGPAFTARVLAATSRRPARARAFDWWRRRWAALVSRPRFALEAAYALTLILVLAAGNPLSAFEWTAARVEPLVGRVSGPVEAIDAGVQALRERMTGVVAAAEAPGSLAATWADWARRTWDDLVASASSGLSRIVAPGESAATRVRQWTRDVFGGAQSAPTEPDASRVRSPL